MGGFSDLVSAAAGENHGGGGRGRGRRRRCSVGIAVAEAWRQIRCLMKRVNEEESNIPGKRCRMPTKERNFFDGRAMNKNRKQVKDQIKTSDALRSWFVVVDHRFITFYMAVSIFSLINYFYIYIYILSFWKTS